MSPGGYPGQEGKLHFGLDIFQKETGGEITFLSQHFLRKCDSFF